jgi:hypothetical protein
MRELESFDTRHGIGREHIAAVNQIAQILMPFSREERESLMKSVAALYGVGMVFKIEFPPEGHEISKPVR